MNVLRSWTSRALVALVVLSLVSLVLLWLTFKPPSSWHQSFSERAAGAQFIVSVLTIIAALAAVAAVAAVAAGILQKQRLQFSCERSAGMSHVYFDFRMRNVGANMAHCHVQVRLDPPAKPDIIRETMNRGYGARDLSRAAKSTKAGTTRAALPTRDKTCPDSSFTCTGGTNIGLKRF